MDVLIACEFSGVVREAFAHKGHNAISCDLVDTEVQGKHYKGDIMDLLGLGWDLMIAHPPCTHLSVSGARWFKDKKEEQLEAIDFFMALINAKIPKICVENPISIMSTKYQKPSQIIQPWQYGHGETKSTCLWLKGLPILQATDLVSGREQRVHLMPPSETRARERSRTYQGIAEAMAEQWG